MKDFVKARNIVTIPLFLILTSSLSFGESDNGPGGYPGEDPPLIIGGGWQEFVWSDIGTFNVEGPFTFNAVVPVILKVTDGYLDGDRFSVYDFGGLIGSTSVPTDDGSQTNNNYDAAYANPKWSSAAFAMGTGNHSITIQTIQIAIGFPAGAGALRADVVPEPGALSLLSIGLIAFARRKRNRA